LQWSGAPDELRKILSAGSGREQALRLAVQLQVAPYLLGELVVGEPVLAALALLPGQGDALAALAAGDRSRGRRGDA